MAIQLSCDYCGQPIEDGNWVKVNALGQEQESYGSQWELVNEFVGYFHSNQERNCYRQLREQISMVCDTHCSLNGTAHAPEELSLRTEMQLRDSRRRSRQARHRELDRQSDSAWRDESLSALRAWKAASLPTRMQWVLDAVGEEALTLRETWESVARAHPECQIYSSYIEPVIKEMVASGDLEKVSTGGKGSQPRWRYQRTSESPEVAALEESLVDSKEQA